MMAQTVLLAALVALAAAPTEYRIAIEHSPRRITVTSGDRVVKETPCAEESLFQALHTGMNAIHAESRVGGANFGASEFRDALTGDKLSVALTGDAREVAVARWYVVGELVGDLGKEADLPAIRAAPRESAKCIYDDFNFGVDSSEVDALQTHYVQYNTMLQALPSFEDQATALSAVEVPQKRPLRIGVLGVTGAGKSTFVTAILGRAVLSRSNEICTGAITEIEHIGEQKAEHFVITYLEEEEKDYFVAADAKKLKDVQSKYAQQCPGGKVTGACEPLKDQLDRQQEATRKMQEAVSQWKPTPVVVQNLNTDPFVSAVGGNRLPELVRKVTLRLDEDILRYATLVDTPGLRDPDPKRRRVALDAITAMDGWIYLMAAGKAETGVIADLREIREEGHNLHGVVCISKVNLLNDPTASKSLDELAHAQKDMFQQYSAMPITYDSAMARAQFGLIRETAVGSEERFLLLRDILDQSYGFGFIRRLVPALRDQSFSDPLKQAFQTLVEKASGHGGSESTSEFHMLEDVLTETSLLITTMRNIAELLQDKIVRRVAADRRTELLASVHDSMDKLRAREATLVQLVAWMDEHEETQRQITARQQDFMAAKEEEELVVQVSGCVSEQLALTSTTQLDSARGSAAQVQQQIEAQVERWFHTSYGESSSTQQATVDGEKFNIRSLAMPFHDFFDGPASTAFGAAFDDLAAQRPKIVAACEAKAAAGKGGSAKTMVKDASDQMQNALVSAIGSEAPAAAADSSGTAGSNACWCTTNTVSRDRSHCKDSICVTMRPGVSGGTKAASSSAPPPPEPAAETPETKEALRAIQRLGAEQATKRMELFGRAAELRLEKAMRSATDAQAKFTEAYRAKTVDAAGVLHELETEEARLAALTAGHERADVEKQLAARRADLKTVTTFDQELGALAGFDVALETVKVRRAAAEEAARKAEASEEGAARDPVDGHDL